MAKNPKDALKAAAGIAKAGVQQIDVNAVKSKASEAGSIIASKAHEVKGMANIAKDDIEDKLTELDRMLEGAINEYNTAYTLMSDKGLSLFIERKQAVDSIGFVENLVNSIANKPKSFESDFAEIDTNRKEFTGNMEFADRKLKAARQAAGSAGTGLAAGASVAFMGPTAAMWVATTFGTASTGTAISALSGIAAQNAALAWLGGGALSASGGGIAAGKALLALAGPIGWSIAGATLLSSIIVFANKKVKLNKEKNDEIERVKINTESVREMDAALSSLLDETAAIRSGLNSCYNGCLQFFGRDYSQFSDEQKMQLGALVNNTKALSAMLGKTVE